MRKIIVGSRQSNLALTQTEQVIADLKDVSERLGLQYTFEVKKILTRGDRILDVTLSKVGGKGLFVKEIEQFMLDGEIDLAVHSMKDLPAAQPEGLVIAATPKRVDSRDCIISKDGTLLKDLKSGSIVGTSSLRRASQLQAFRPDLTVKPIRGNIDSRLRKLQEEDFSAIVLAAAGIERVGWHDRVTEYLNHEICIPAVGQGALGIQCRQQDEEILALLAQINDKETAYTIQAERSFLARLNGGCQIPIGAHAVLSTHKQTGEKGLRLTGFVGSPDGKVILKEDLFGVDAETLGTEVAEKLLTKGAEEILASLEEVDMR